MRRLAAVTAAVLLVVVAPAAQEAVRPAPVTGFMHAIHATDDIEKTLAFYTRVFGLAADIRPFANAAVPILTDSPGVILRVAMMRLPGDGFKCWICTGCPGGAPSGA
jgi:hypothetical protein